MKAVFVDRDGVINHNWRDPRDGRFVAPEHPEDYRLRDGVTDALLRLHEDGWVLFLISNQPSAVLGKSTMADLAAVHVRFLGLMDEARVPFTDCFFAYGHPDVEGSDLRGRKPSPWFIDRAIEEHRLDRAACWMIGDRDTDITCARNARIRSIQVTSSEPDGYAGKEKPDFRADDLAGAVAIVLREG